MAKATLFNNDDLQIMKMSCSDKKKRGTIYENFVFNYALKKGVKTYVLINEEETGGLMLVKKTSALSHKQIADKIAEVIKGHYPLYRRKHLSAGVRKISFELRPIEVDPREGIYYFLNSMLEVVAKADNKELCDDVRYKIGNYFKKQDDCVKAAIRIERAFNPEPASELNEDNTFNPNDYVLSELSKSNNVVIHCNTENEANELFDIVANSGLGWWDLSTKSTHWDIYEDAVCYELSSGLVWSKPMYEQEGYRILEYGKDKDLIIKKVR